MRLKKKSQVINNTNYFKNMSLLDAEKVLKQLKSSKKGLSEKDIEVKRENYGKNAFTSKKFTWQKRLLHNISNPFVIILLIIVIYNFVSYFIISNYDLTDLVSAIIVLTMVIISVSISYFQDYRSHKAADKLRKLVETTASVFREHNKKIIDFNNFNSVANNTKEILIEELVLGDIIFLSSGDMVPADVRVLASVDLFINQSSLTGESIPVEKHAKNSNKNVHNILEMQNLAFMGTNVISGVAIAIVIATGNTSYFGKIATSITNKKPATSFDIGIKRVSYILLTFTIVMVSIIFLLNGLIKQNYLKALIFAISVAVGITPELLPMIVSANLAKGALKLAKKKVIVKNLSSIQNFGAMDILCTDKTGTLTKEKIELVKYLDPSGKSSEKVLEYGYLNSIFQTGLKNTIDKTIIEHIKKAKNSILNEKYHKIDEIPFDFARRKLSIIVNKNEKENTLICKGAVEEILKNCSHYELNNQIKKIDEATKRKIFSLTQELNQQGLRVIAIGYQNFSAKKTVFNKDDEDDLILLGYIGFLDIVKKSAVSAIKTLKNSGIDVKILTGDNEIVTTAICKKVGLDPRKPLLGSEIEKLTNRELKEIVNETTIFAKMNPLQKARIIDILKSKKHTVGFLGDGINDAVALQHADVGISVNSATDIAKEASDIILLEKDLDVLYQGVISGRVTFANILKYIKITISSNFGNTLSVLIASSWIAFYPMIGIQILLQNLLYDLSQLSIPWDKVDPEFTKKPQRWNTKNIIPFALWNGPLSSLFDITTFLFLGYGLNIFANPSSANIAIFQSGWFILGITSQTLIFNMLRTEKIPFFQRTASWPVLTTTALIAIIGISIPFIPFSKSISLVSVPPIFFAYLVSVVVVYFILSQLWKMLYIKINKRWI